MQGQDEDVAVAGGGDEVGGLSAQSVVRLEALWCLDVREW